LSGASKTPLSLHNFDSARDYQIFIDGKLASGNDKYGTEPYQVLGHFAREKDLFWGWGWDSGHIAKERFTVDFLRNNTYLKDDKNVKQLFEYFKGQENIPKRLEPLVNTLEEFYGEKINKQFYGDEEIIEDLLPPINPYK
jgi:hypothetical protein